MEMSGAPALADRVLDGALACVGRFGVAKTTLDDVAREAGCARATVYRSFPGRRALFGAMVEREVAALGDRLLVAAADADTLADAVVAVIRTGARTFHTHAALRFVLAHEPESIAPQLSFEHGSAMLRVASALVAPAFTRFVPADRADRLGEWITRLTLSYLCNPSEHVDLDDPAQVRELVDAFVLPGFNPSSTFASAFTGASAVTGEGASQ
jgi:AcrR family transcriptional regulator